MRKALGQKTDFIRCRGKFVFILPKPTIKMKKIQTKTINIQAIKKFGCLVKLWCFQESRNIFNWLIGREKKPLKCDNNFCFCQSTVDYFLHCIFYALIEIEINNFCLRQELNPICIFVEFFRLFGLHVCKCAHVKFCKQSEEVFLPIRVKHHRS